MSNESAALLFCMDPITTLAIHVPPQCALLLSLSAYDFGRFELRQIASGSIARLGHSLLKTAKGLPIGILRAGLWWVAEGGADHNPRLTQGTGKLNRTLLNVLASDALLKYLISR